MEGGHLICPLTLHMPPWASHHLLRVVFISWYLLESISVDSPRLLFPVARAS